MRRTLILSLLLALTFTFQGYSFHRLMRGVEVSSPPVSEAPEVVPVADFMKADPPVGGFVYVYGGKTDYDVVKTKDGTSVFACYLDNADFSGVTIALGAGKSVDLSQKRAGGLAFWARTGPDVRSIYVGLLDDMSNGHKTQTRLRLGDFGEIDTTWRYYMIPLRRFLDRGRYWDENIGSEVIDDVQWENINELRFSSNMNENRVEEGKPVILYVHDVKFIEEIPGYVCPEEFWGAFESDTPDLQLHDFSTEQDRKWETSTGPKSSGSFEFVEAAPEESQGYSIKINYSLHDWVDIIYNYRDNNSPAEHRDWTNHWGLKFDVYTERAFQPFNVQVNDSGNELWIATAGAERGWTEVVVAFRDFYKFPHWQPPNAVHTGNFDLESVVALDFKPSGEGTSAQFKVHNVRLTNDREARRAPVPEYVNVTVTGNVGDVVTEKINEGLFGINAALWDGDLLLPETEKYVRAVNHHVLRYPGGLRADDDNWKEVLAAQDWMVDTDQFLEFCRATNTEAMITVNFGSGTVEDAADWVRHHNVDNDDNVRYWEVGNELYGDWHPFQTSAEDYGKRTREFIIAMKEVDPTIKVTFVGVLEGEWNRTVMKHVKDVADGINVHHYPQTTGEENDAGLLSSPQTLDDIIPNIRKMLKEHGEPGKEYEIWLTEWNSVDFEPGPQTLSIVNGLFVADYLGMLTKHNIEQASYWDIHNDITDQGGDYGYLSRTGAPDGCNVPRPSYWAFKMASHSLGRGSLLKSGTESDYVTSYLTVDQGKKSLMLINKYPMTRADVTIDIPGFEGKATKQLLNAESGQAGPGKESMRVKKGSQLSLPPYSITTITLD